MKDYQREILTLSEKIKELDKMKEEIAQLQDIVVSLANQLHMIKHEEIKA